MVARQRERNDEARGGSVEQEERISSRIERGVPVLVLPVQQLLLPGVDHIRWEGLQFQAPDTGGSPSPSASTAAGVYCLTSYGDVHVLLLPERRRRADNPSSLPAIRPSLSGPANHAEFARWPMKQQHDFIRRRSLGPDLNAAAKVQARPFAPATSFAPPYNTVSAFAGAKNLVFCEGNLYQIWRNSSCTVTVRLPEGGRRRVAENEVFVFRCFPQRQPCWDAVTDLGGYSVFLGRNNAVSMPPAEGVPGFKGNCVYWIGGRGRDQGMVFDMATGRSTPCLPAAAAAAAGVAPQSTVCWYFVNDMVNNCNNVNGGK
ncbi:uncharacterized protein LOC124690958 [Lolium rigidum]|uniref:uncharacterized protein LOC124690958 n=1 Tax=Lolium rigidum TaxID=89674 RepID=UPI001F5D20DC|nr:uncharacterized protein LOC124690958 [Lolium rigidum]